MSAYRERGCTECGKMPARLILPETHRRLCGVCAHDLAVLQDLIRRVLAWRGAA